MAPDRTSSSDLLPEKVKMQRTVICRKAIRPTDNPRSIKYALYRVTSEDQYGPLQSTEIASLVRFWDNGEDQETTIMTRVIVSTVIARAQRHDDLWFTLASKEMSVTESVLRNYATHGNNLSLALFNYVVRHHFIFHGESPYVNDFSQVLKAASKFDVLDTSPELQHEFCELWNQIFHDDSPYCFFMPWFILRPIRNIYLTLHQHTDSAPTAFSTSTDDEDEILKPWSTYPLCTIPGHRPHLATDIHDGSASTATPRPALHDNTAPGPTFPPDASSLSVITPIPVDENTADVPQIVLAPPSHAHQTTTGDHNSATSPDPAAALAARDNSPARTIPPTIHVASTPTPPVPPPSEVSFQNNADLLASHSGSREIPPSTSPEPVLENIFPTGTSPTLTIICPNLTHVLPRIPFLADSQYVSGHVSMADLRTWVGCRY